MNESQYRVAKRKEHSGISKREISKLPSRLDISRVDRTRIQCVHIDK